MMKRLPFTVLILFFYITPAKPICELRDFLYFKRIHLASPTTPLKLTSAPQGTDIYIDLCQDQTENLIKICPELNKDKKYFYVKKTSKNCKGIGFDKVKDIIYKKGKIDFNLKFDQDDITISIFPVKSVKDTGTETDSYKYDKEKKNILIKIFKQESTPKKYEIEVVEGYLWNTKENFLWLIFGILKIVSYGSLMIPFKLGEPLQYNGRFKPLDFMINYLFAFYVIDAIFEFFNIFHPIFCSVVIVLGSAVYAMFTSYSIWATKKVFVCKYSSIIFFLSFLDVDSDT